MWDGKHIKPRYLLVLLALVGLNGVGFSAEGINEPVSVVHCTDKTASLDLRWEWALEQIPNQPATKHCWIGFRPSPIWIPKGWPSMEHRMGAI